MALDLDQSKKPKGRTVQKRKKLKGGKEAAKKGKRSKVEKGKKESKFDIIEVSSPPLWIKVSVIHHSYFCVNILVCSCDCFFC